MFKEGEVKKMMQLKEWKKFEESSQGGASNIKRKIYSAFMKLNSNFNSSMHKSNNFIHMSI